EHDYRRKAAEEEKNDSTATATTSTKEKRGSFLRRGRSKRGLVSNNSNQQQNGGAVASGDGIDGGSSTMLGLCRKVEKQLEQKVGGGDHNTAILQSTMNPCDPFIADDFLSPYDEYRQPMQKVLPDPVQHAAEQRASEDERLERRRARRPQVAFRRLFQRREDPMDMDALNSLDGGPARIFAEMRAEEMRARGLASPPSLTPTSGDASGDTDKSHEVFKEDIYMTTPLHEAARLGAGNFVRFLLARGGDPNVRNGHLRTALHACAGGLTVEEDSLKCSLKASSPRKKSTSFGAESTASGVSTSNETRSVGIRATFIPDEIYKLMQHDVDAKPSSDKKAGLFGRLFGSSHDAKSSSDNAPVGDVSIESSKNTPDPVRRGALCAQRMDAILALLSWVQQETCDGPSINAVDANGRTALHYAAEMGRSDLCMALLSNFGAMLTIVDDLGARTPCELASSQGHKELAAQLEARALLYIDPYGLDDDLMENMNAVSDESGPRGRLVPPFKWFQTFSLDEIDKEIQQRIAQTRSEMLLAAEKYDPGGPSLTAINEQETCGEAASGSSASVESDAVESDSEFQESTSTLDLVATPVVSKSNEPSDCIVSHQSNAQYMFENLQDYHVERFLTFHKWNTKKAVQEFRKDPIGAFLEAEIPLASKPKPAGKTGERICRICYDDDVAKEDWMTLRSCEHGFCKACLSDYIKDRAKDKAPIFSITCPHHECTAVFSQQDIETLLVDEQPVLERLHKAATESFVAVSDDFKFCPFPSCQGIVHRLPHKKFSSNGFDTNVLDYTGATCVAVQGEKKIGDGCTVTYEGIEDLEYNNCHSLKPPPMAHRFCFACGESVHWPVTCDRLGKWQEKIREEIGEVDNEGTDFNDLAQKMWIKANTQTCPSCNVNIEKNDGCNHMICSNPQCLYEFCWICRKDWKLHGTSTGGFFRCNIWQEDESGVESTAQPDEIPIATLDADLTTVDEFGTAANAARTAWRKKQEMDRFIHHYTRWEAHEQSATLERKMGDAVCTRLAPVVEAAMEFDGSSLFNFGGQGLSFVHSAFTELLECRSVLRHSYAFSYFRYPTFSNIFVRRSPLYGNRTERNNFERLQSELETLTEQMSDIVARSHLRATQVQISFLTAGAAEKRVEFTKAVFQIYKDEKNGIKNQQRRKARKKAVNEAYKQATEDSQSSASSPSLAEIMAMHQSGRENNFVDDGLNVALDGFMDRARAAEHQGSRRDVLDNGPVQMWSCSQCTYMNSGGRRCEMCGNRR
ncbi:MAG: hypothetical protein SGILL_004635, partial [Bacillariaceae sp.]